MKKDRFMKLIIPMAGRGTRVRPHSHVRPKPLLHVRGQSIVERIVSTFDRVLPVHLDEAVFIMGPDFGRDVYAALQDVCDRYEVCARFAVQPFAGGTAHAVHVAAEHLCGEGIVAFADTLFEVEPGVRLEGVDVLAWVKHVEDPSRFGIAVRENGKVVELIEKPSEPISNEALIGLYYVRDLADLARVIQEVIDDDLRGKGGEFQLTDVFDRMLKRGDVFETTPVTEWLDCGTIPALRETTWHVLETEAGDVHRGEVVDSVILEPAYVGEGARVVDSVVGPYVSIEAGANIRRSVLRRSIVFPHATIEGAVLEDSLVGGHARVRPGAWVLNVGDHAEID